MYFVDGVKKQVEVELFGGPHDGARVACPLAPPPCFLLPTEEDQEVSLYIYETLSYMPGNNLRLRYCYQGRESIDQEKLITG